MMSSRIQGDSPESGLQSSISAVSIVQGRPVSRQTHHEAMNTAAEAPACAASAMSRPHLVIG